MPWFISGESSKYVFEKTSDCCTWPKCRSLKGNTCFTLVLWTSPACCGWCMFHGLLSDTDPHLSNSMKGINFLKLTGLGRNEMKCCFSCGKMKEAIRELNVGKSHQGTYLISLILQNLIWWVAGACVCIEILFLYTIIIFPHYPWHNCRALYVVCSCSSGAGTVAWNTTWRRISGNCVMGLK